MECKLYLDSYEAVNIVARTGSLGLPVTWDNYQPPLSARVAPLTPMVMSQHPYLVQSAGMSKHSIRTVLTNMKQMKVEYLNEA